MRRSLRDTIAGIIAAPIVVTLIWFLARGIFHAPSYILPDPARVLSAALLSENGLAENAQITLFESALGFLLGNTLAMPIAVLFQLSGLARHVMMPIAICLKTTPIVAIAPLLLIWFGPGMHTKVMASAAVCFFPMLVGLHQAMEQTPYGMIEYYRSLGAGRFEEALKLRLLYSIPEVFAALRVSSALAVVGAVVGEMVSATAGLGHVVISATYSFQTPLTFAAIIAMGLCGMSLYAGVLLAEIIVGVRRWRDG